MRPADRLSYAREKAELEQLLQEEAAGDGVFSTLEIARELGLAPIPLPARPAYAAARALSRVPFLPTSVGWFEAVSHPAVMDTTRARTGLGWAPQYTGLEALRATLHPH